VNPRSNKKIGHLRLRAQAENGREKPRSTVHARRRTSAEANKDEALDRTTAFGNTMGISKAPETILSKIEANERFLNLPCWHQK
jgi:hypothetical protein